MAPIRVDSLFYKVLVTWQFSFVKELQTDSYCLKKCRPLLTCINSRSAPRQSLLTVESLDETHGATVNVLMCSGIVNGHAFTIACSSLRLNNSSNMQLLFFSSCPLLFSSCSLSSSYASSFLCLSLPCDSYPWVSWLSKQQIFCCRLGRQAKLAQTAAWASLFVLSCKAHHPNNLIVLIGTVNSNSNSIQELENKNMFSLSTLDLCFAGVFSSWSPLYFITWNTCR